MADDTSADAMREAGAPLPTPEPAAESTAPPKSLAREYFESLSIALVLALIIRTFVLQSYLIPSGSMEPTLLVGDHIMVNKLSFGLRMPESLFGLAVPGVTTGHYLFHLEPIERGEVVVFVFPPDRSKDFVKRVIGIAGDTVEVKRGRVWVNGAPVPDPHAHFEVADNERSGFGNPRDNFGPVTVPAGKLFAMGDNRDVSWDSRYWGFVDYNDVEGRPLFIYWSWDSDDPSLSSIRWSRFGMIVR
ncbi:MAG TPA: signal peptidase I [Candidatus Binataceae bacterium]|nr:signal peptidase I [Candidatus Binataceae bacterium]